MGGEERGLLVCCNIRDTVVVGETLGVKAYHGQLTMTAQSTLYEDFVSFWPWCYQPTDYSLGDWYPDLYALYNRVWYRD
jgi:hypothetical protein